MCPLLQDLVEVYLIFATPLHSFTLPRYSLQPQKILIHFGKKKHAKMKNNYWKY